MALSNQRNTPTTPSQPCQRRRWRQTGKYRESAFFTALLSLSLSSFSRQPSGAAADATTDMKVVGYYGPHRFNGRNGLSKPENIDFTKLTRINYGPFQINEHGSIWGTDINADPQLLFGPQDWNPPDDAPMFCHKSSPDAHMQCAHHYYEKGLIYGAHMNGAEVYPVIGGPERSEKFSEMAANPEARMKFAQNAALFMTNYAFDGIDIAWQFPQSLEDMSNYSILLSEVRLALDKEGQVHGRTFGLTATVPCGHDNMLNIDIRLLNSVLSEFNLLSFDFHGPLDDKVGVNSPLYDQNDGEGNSVNSCVIKYMEGGASRNKINIGLAFYGHSFRGGKYMGDECTSDWAGICSDTQSWQEDGGSPQYHNIYTKMPGMSLSFDLQTMTPLASNGRGVVSFDDPRSICLKTEYAISNGLNGFIIMDLAGDMLDDRSTPLLDALNLKLLKPSINCAGKDFEELFQWRKVVQYNPNASLETDVAIIDSKPGPTYRYTCGIGEGNAKDRCNSQEMDDMSCDTGICPPNELCFVVLCTKPREHEVQEQPAEAYFSKAKPKPKPRPKSVVEESYTLTETKKKRPVPNSAEEILPRKEMGAIVGVNTVPSNTAPPMSFSCGVTFEHAQSCGKLCPNGLTDCPSGQFCFWLKCEAATSVLAEPPASLARTETKYQCGETRDIALTCSEDCGFAWQCPEGKDCYSVPCSV